jgi:Cholesterol oxidase, substrate-binding/FAD binding domain
MTPITQTPPGWPAGIPIVQEQYLNWSWEIDVQNLWTCAPRTADDVVTVCNWAKDHKYQVRARGIMHGWSPLTIVGGTSPGASIILVDLTQNLAAMTFIPRTATVGPQVKVGTGATMLALLTFLEQQSGGQGAAKGYSFPHTPAPGNLTLGGVLAINAHGTAIPSAADSFPCSYGSLSNQILAFTAVVTDPKSPNPDQYSLRTFTRGEGDDIAFLTHIGKALLVDATLQVIDNYNLRCQSYTTLSAATLFAAPASASSSAPPPNSMADFLSKYGRVEAIWYPFSDAPWLKVWSFEATKPSSSRAVTGPYNYPFSDNLPDWVTNLIKSITSGAGWLTPSLGQTMAGITGLGLDASFARDLWGPSKNTLVYIDDATLRVTANGYAVQMKSADVQQAIADFTGKFTAMLADYQKKGLYPINSPLEIRITSLDDPAKVAAPAGTTARSPVISSLSYDEVAKQNGWDVALWLDVLTLPGTPAADDFYLELETWITQTFSGPRGRAIPEWSKGWAYTSAGAWQNQDFFKYIRGQFTTGRSADHNWQYEVATLQTYDKHGLFSNPLLDQLFVKP